MDKGCFVTCDVPAMYVFPALCCSQQHGAWLFFGLFSSVLSLLQVVYSTTGQVGEQPVDAPRENGVDEDEDFDIDAI